MTLRDLYQTNDIKGFIKELQRLYPGKSRAVTLWQEFSFSQYPFEDPELEDDNPLTNENLIETEDVWTHPVAIERGWITQRWEESPK